MRLRSRIFGVVLGSAIGLSAGLPGTLRAQPAAAQLRVAEVAPIAPYWPSFIAQDKGFYARNGVAVTVTHVGNATAAVQQLVGGSYDMSSTTLDTAGRAAAGGAGIALVGVTVAKYPYSIMASPNIRTAADLKGKTVILAFQKDLTSVVWNRWLQSQGMRPSDVDQVYDGSTPNRFAALTGKRVQAAMLSQPFDLRAKGDGQTKLLDLGAFAGNLGFLGVIARPDWLRANPDAARGFLKAQGEAVDWLHDPANRAQAVEILVRYTKQDAALAEQTYDYYVNDLQPFSRNLAVPQGMVAELAKVLAEVGDIRSAAAIPAGFENSQYLPGK